MQAFKTEKLRMPQAISKSQNKSDVTNHTYTGIGNKPLELVAMN